MEKYNFNPEYNLCNPYLKCNYFAINDINIHMSSKLSVNLADTRGICYVTKGKCSIWSEAAQGH